MQADPTHQTTAPRSGNDTVVTEHGLPLRDDTMTVRVTRPAQSPGLLPAVLIPYDGALHVSLDTGELEIDPLATRVGCVVISLAPAHPVLVRLENSVSAWLWVHEQATMLGVDVTRIAIAGTTAGDDLSEAVSVAARDRGLPQPLLDRTPEHGCWVAALQQAFTLP